MASHTRSGTTILTDCSSFQMGPLDSCYYNCIFDCKVTFFTLSGIDQIPVQMKQDEHNVPRYTGVGKNASTVECVDLFLRRDKMDCSNLEGV